MWRDRTNLSVAPQLSSSPAIHADFISSFISYRQSYSHHPAKRKPLYGGPSNGYADNAALSDERRGLMSAFDDDNNGDAVIEMDVLPPRWLDIQDEVTERLQDIAKQTKRLDQLHQKHVLPGFDDEDVKKREEREIERLTQEITRGFQSCQQAIKRIDAMLRESAQREGGASKGEEVMARNLKVSLASRISESSAAFRKKQSAYLKSVHISIPPYTLNCIAYTRPRTPRSRRLVLSFPHWLPRPSESIHRSFPPRILR